MRWAEKIKEILGQSIPAGEKIGEIIKCLKNIGTILSNNVDIHSRPNNIKFLLLSK